MGRDARKPVLGISDRSHTNRPVQSHKMIRWLETRNFGFRVLRKCPIRVAKTKTTDQLRSYCEADLCLCFRLCKNPVFARRGS